MFAMSEEAVNIIRLWMDNNYRYLVLRLKDGNWERVTEQFFQFKEDAIGYTAEHSLWNNGYLYALVDGCELTHIFIAGKQVYPTEDEWR